jgi:hypothetical protein
MAYRNNRSRHSVTARDGVDTRKKENWARVAAKAPVAQETICRSDMINGLGLPAAQLGNFVSTMSWGEYMTGTVALCARPVTPESERRPRERMLALWKDMIEDPAKYGDDLVMWLDLDATLRNTSKTFKMDDVWAERQAAILAKEKAEQAPWRALYTSIAKEAANEGGRRWSLRDIRNFVRRRKEAAVKIQALVRGYQARCHDVHQDCSRCLCHRICPTLVDGLAVCNECLIEEALSRAQEEAYYQYKLDREMDRWD